MASPLESCSNCKFFLLLQQETGKGVCRVNPPNNADDRNQSPIKNDSDGRRWPICWRDEWCGRWLKQ